MNTTHENLDRAPEDIAPENIANMLWPFYSYFFLDSELAKLFMGHWLQTQPILDTEEQAFAESFTFFRSYDGSQLNRQDLFELELWKDFREKEGISSPAVSVFSNHLIYTQAEQMDPLVRAVLFLIYVKEFAIGQIVSILQINSIELESLKRQAFRFLVRVHLKKEILADGLNESLEKKLDKDKIPTEISCFFAQEIFFNFFPKPDSFFDQADRLFAHLKYCQACTNKWQQYKSFFNDLIHYEKVPFPKIEKSKLSEAADEKKQSWISVIKKWFSKMDRQGKFRRPA